MPAYTDKKKDPVAAARCKGSVSMFITRRNLIAKNVRKGRWGAVH